MVKTKIKYIMVDKNIKSVSQLSRDTKIARNTLKKIIDNENTSTLKLEILYKLCDYFKCPLSDLIEYIPEEEIE